jgi:siroheme synthase-like protein
VAARKASGLLNGGAFVTVVAPELSQDMEALHPQTVHRRPYARGEVARYRLVVTATGMPDVDAAVFADAEAAGIWCNSADDLDHSSFILPSVHRDGAVTVTVSSAGQSPALSSWLRRRIASQLGTGYGDLAALLADVRRQLHEAGRSTETVDWAGLLSDDLLELVRRGDLDAARSRLEGAAGLS